MNYIAYARLTWLLLSHNEVIMRIFISKIYSEQILNKTNLRHITLHSMKGTISFELFMSYSGSHS